MSRRAGWQKVVAPPRSEDRPTGLPPRFPPGFVPAKVYMGGPEFLAWLRAAWAGGAMAGQRTIWPNAPTFEQWLSECLGTDSVQTDPPESPNP